MYCSGELLKLTTVRKQRMKSWHILLFSDSRCYFDELVLLDYWTVFKVFRCRMKLRFRMFCFFHLPYQNFRLDMRKQAGEWQIRTDSHWFSVNQLEMEAQLDIKVYIAKYSIIPSGKNLFQITASNEVPDQFLEESKLPNSHRATFA